MRKKKTEKKSGRGTRLLVGRDGEFVSLREGQGVLFRMWQATKRGDTEP